MNFLHIFILQDTTKCLKIHIFQAYSWALIILETAKRIDIYRIFALCLRMTFPKQKGHA